MTAQLIDAKSDSHLWSRTYDDVVTTHNLFWVQENIARRVSDALEVRLVPGGSHEAPNSIETLDLYYDGLALFREL